jgi:hypothetical protein
MESQTNIIQPILPQNDHDTLIRVETTLNLLAAEVKQYNSNNASLELRVRTLENTRSEAFGGWRIVVLFGGAISGLAGLVVGLLNIFQHH